MLSPRRRPTNENESETENVASDSFRNGTIEVEVVKNKISESPTFILCSGISSG